MVKQTIEERIKQRRIQYLLHCYLYYEMDFTIISDETYWRFCDELITLQKEYPELCSAIPYNDICMMLDNAYTSPTIYNPKFNYPINIISRAAHAYARENDISLRETADRFGLTITPQRNNLNNFFNELKKKKMHMIELYNSHPALHMLYES